MSSVEERKQHIRDSIRVIPNWPKEGGPCLWACGRTARVTSYACLFWDAGHWP